MKKAVLAVDPGLISGVCFITWSDVAGEDPVIEYSVETDAEKYAGYIRGSLQKWETYDFFAVVCERFVINAQTVRKSQAPYSLEQIGVLKQLCRDSGFPVAGISFQSPVDAKNMFPNRALKTLEFWHVGGAGHALDSIRHGLLYMVRKFKWIPRALLTNIEE
jgi:hypothetical protein